MAGVDHSFRHVRFFAFVVHLFRFDVCHVSGRSPRFSWLDFFFFDVSFRVLFRWLGPDPTRDGFPTPSHGLPPRLHHGRDQCPGQADHRHDGGEEERERSHAPSRGHGWLAVANDGLSHRFPTWWPRFRRVYLSIRSDRRGRVFPFKVLSNPMLEPNGVDPSPTDADTGGEGKDRKKTERKGRP